MALLLPIIVFVGMYFLILRPQQKRMKEREALVRAAGVGDEVATVGGVIGIIVAEDLLTRAAFCCSDVRYFGAISPGHKKRG